MDVISGWSRAKILERGISRWVLSARGRKSNKDGHLSKLKSHP